MRQSVEQDLEDKLERLLGTCFAIIFQFYSFCLLKKLQEKLIQKRQAWKKQKWFSKLS